jgi:HlyD family secretion protein
VSALTRSIAAALAAAALAACDKPSDTAWQGYIEGEFVQLAAPYAGQLQKLYVHRGDKVEAGKPVFALEQESEHAARTEAEQRLKATQARLENLKASRRAPEIEALRAEVTQAKAARELSAAQLAQQQRLFTGGFISQSRLDEAKTAQDRDRARVVEAEAQLRNALQPLGRDAEIKAARGDIAAAQAALAQAAWKLEQRSVAAPVSGLVQDTYFVEGEWVPAGRPLVLLLPPGNVKARFYVPEIVLGSLQPGRRLEIRCDGCPSPLEARVSYLSSQAEYTPPVLYSKESRSKLLFLVEARLAPGGTALHPGQPVDVRLK